MPKTPEPIQEMLIEREMDLDPFPPYAYCFVHEGLDFTVTSIHGRAKADKNENRHVNGQELCEGLKELALAKWGRMARVVLQKWNLHTTFDFGRVVYSMIEMGQMQKVEEDSIDDFRSVYDFKTVFETEYCIPSQP